MELTDLEKLILSGNTEFALSGLILGYTFLQENDTFGLCTAYLVSKCVNILQKHCAMQKEVLVYYKIDP